MSLAEFRQSCDAAEPLGASWGDEGSIVAALTATGLMRVELTGPAVPAVDDVSPGMYAGADFDVSNTGTLVFRRKPGASTVHWMDCSGQATPLLAAPAEYFLPSLSPDGSRLAFLLVDGEFRADPPRPWVDAQLADTGVGPGFEIAPDGRLVALMAPPRAVGPQGASDVTLVLNFFSEVKRRTSP